MLGDGRCWLRCKIPQTSVCVCVCVRESVCMCACACAGVAGSCKCVCVCVCVCTACVCDCGELGECACVCRGGYAGSRQTTQLGGWGVGGGCTAVDTHAVRQAGSTNKHAYANRCTPARPPTLIDSLMGHACAHRHAHVRRLKGTHNGTYTGMQMHVVTKRR